MYFFPTLMEERYCYEAERSPFFHDLKQLDKKIV